MHCFRCQNSLAIFALAMTFCGLAPRCGIAQTTPLLGVVVDGKKYTGTVLFRDANTLGLLRRDGGLSTFPARDVTSAIELTKPFAPYSRDELEDRLRNEFRSGYSVAFTENFAVVFPTNSSLAWSTTFERLYRQFRHYFESRGFPLTRSEFPLIAVVLRTRGEFDDYLEQVNLSNPSKIVGIYSLKSNRVITYDQAISGSGRAESNFKTVIHEAAHQAAFNSGIHERFRPIPRWVTEGLATMFEANGVHNAIEYPKLRDRIDTVYFAELQKRLPVTDFRGTIHSLVCSDELFDSDPPTAYAVAWGLSLFLAENRPEQYRMYLAATKQREDFSRDTPERRLHDFCGVFGDDLRDLETRLMQYFDGLSTEP